jgi:hypothetical protein
MAFKAYDYYYQEEFSSFVNQIQEKHSWKARGLLFLYFYAVLKLTVLYLFISLLPSD